MANTYPISSLTWEFHDKLMGYGVASSTSMSLTLNVGDSMAHCGENNTSIEAQK